MVRRLSSVDDVPAFTYLRSLRQQRVEINEAIARVLDSGTLILGPEVVAFEREFAKFVDVEHCIGVSSGTDALVLALRALQIGDGDEVITTANGPVPTASAIRMVGAVPKFVDIDLATYQIDPQQVQQAIGPRTRAVIVIHLYGLAAPVSALATIAANAGVPLIEDCAQAHGTCCGGRHVGGAGRIGCFSFYPTKNLGAFGDAGACVTQDPVLAGRLRQLRQYGDSSGQRIADIDGGNSRMDELQAAILRCRLRHLPAALDRRRQIAQRYLEELKNDEWVLPRPIAKSLPSWHQFVIRTAERDAWIARLRGSGIGAAVHYRHPIHRMPAFQPWCKAHDSLPATDTACQQVMSLPIFPELTDTEVDTVIDACRDLSATLPSK